MLRLALILPVFYLVAQVYGRETSPTVDDKEDDERFLKRFYDLVLQERDLPSCGIPESYVNCGHINGCENNECPGDQYCCQTNKCGNMCLCKREPENCELFCRYGYNTKPNGCYMCSCKQGIGRLLRRLLGPKTKRTDNYGEEDEVL